VVEIVEIEVPANVVEVLNPATNASDAIALAIGK